MSGTSAVGFTRKRQLIEQVLAELRRRLIALPYGHWHPVCDGLQVHRIGGYSAHADQQDLIDFVGEMPTPPWEICLVPGDAGAKAALAERLRAVLPKTECLVGLC